MKVLIIKMTSMGDIIHLFPALTDAVNHCPDIRFDWVIEESFQELPKWHPSVNDIIPLALRRWRRSPISIIREPTLKNVLTKLRRQSYDLVIDAQGLLKSAIISSFAKGPVAGLDWKSAREKSASWLYQRKCAVSPQQHAVKRMRELFAKALDYAVPDNIPDYGLQLSPGTRHDETPEFLVFFHGTTWPNKHWPAEYWQQLITIATSNGFNVYLPWGNETEKKRAEMWANNATGASVLPKMRLTELAQFLVNAKGVIAVDTGLAHLSAALAKPTVSIYGPTDPNLTGTLGKNQLHLAANFSCAPCLRRSCNYKAQTPVQPACFTTLPPEYVWQEFSKII